MNLIPVGIHDLPYVVLPGHWNSRTGVTTVTWSSLLNDEFNENESLYYLGILRSEIRSKLRYHEYPVGLVELTALLQNTKFNTYPIKVRIQHYYCSRYSLPVTREKFNHMVQERSYYIWQNKGFTNCYGRYYQICPHTGLCDSTICQGKNYGFAYLLTSDEHFIVID